MDGPSEEFNPDLDLVVVLETNDRRNLEQLFLHITGRGIRD